MKLGTTRLSSRNDGATQVIDIAERIKHPGYRPPSKYNDIALLRLKTRARFTAYVRPACINVQPELENQKAIAIGFGKTSYGE